MSLARVLAAARYRYSRSCSATFVASKMTGIPFLSSSSIRAWQAEKRRLFSLSSYLGEGKRILRLVSLAKMRKGSLSASLRQKNDCPCLAGR